MSITERNTVSAPRMMHEVMIDVIAEIDKRDDLGLESCRACLPGSRIWTAAYMATNCATDRTTGIRNAPGPRYIQGCQLDSAT
jgi:hypothetical protein